MRAFVTGGAGFLGGAVVRLLLARGHEVVAAVRDPSRATALTEAGCTLVASNLADARPLLEPMRQCDVVFHVAGMYRVGIPASARRAMYEANVGTTEVVLDAAASAEVPRTVYVSTINVFGDTGGTVVDETYRRPEPPRYLSEYDRTKHLAHLVAERRIADGLPIVIVIPGGVYGPNDPSQLGASLRQAAAGTLPAVIFPDLGMNMVHVDDLAAGILAAAERGTNGDAYVLGGELVRVRGLVARAAAAGGHRPPRLSVPNPVMRAAAFFAAPLGRVIGRDVAEVVRAGAGVTYWASDAKARRELGYAPRDLESGLRATFGRGGR